VPGHVVVAAVGLTGDDQAGDADDQPPRRGPIIIMLMNSTGPGCGRWRTMVRTMVGGGIVRTFRS